MISEPSIAILVATYNRAHFLPAALESALAQSFAATEILVTDDASTDDTAEVVAPFVARGVDYERRAHAGVAAVRNRLVARCTAPWFVWLDSDDMLEPDALARYAAALREEPDVDVWYGQHTLIDADGGVTGTRSFEEYGPDGLLPALVHGCAVPQPGACLRTEAVRELGGYDSSVDGTEDYDFYVRAAGTLRFRAVPHTVCRYRLHGNQLIGMDTGAYARNRDAIVLGRMMEQHGLEAMFPDCFDGDPETGRTAALLRMANVYYERRAPVEGEALLREAEGRLDAAGDGSGVRDEAAAVLYRLAISDRPAYRALAPQFAQRWPGDPRFRRHRLMARLPARVHHWLRRRMKAEG